MDGANSLTTNSFTHGSISCSQIYAADTSTPWITYKTTATVRLDKSFIKRVLFHPPATIVYWNDGTKTVVKCKPGEKFDQYYGFCAALAKKLFGSSGEARHVAGIKRVKEPKPTKETAEPCGCIDVDKIVDKVDSKCRDILLRSNPARVCIKLVPCEDHDDKDN